MSICYFDFEISRVFACAPSDLFKAWADAKVKSKWFVGPAGWVETERTVDLREGGIETMAGNFDGKLTTEYTGHFYDVQPDERIGYSFEVRLGGEIYSISTAVVEFVKTDGGTEMKFHEQLAVFSGQTVEEARPNRIAGTSSHFDRLADLLDGKSIESGDSGSCGATQVSTTR